MERLTYSKCVKCGREIWDNTPDLTRLIVSTVSGIDYCFSCWSKQENITSIEILGKENWDEVKINEFSSDELEAQK